LLEVSWFVFCLATLEMLIFVAKIEWRKDEIFVVIFKKAIFSRANLSKLLSKQSESEGGH